MSAAGIPLETLDKDQLKTVSFIDFIEVFAIQFIYHQLAHVTSTSVQSLMQR